MFPTNTFIGDCRLNVTSIVQSSESMATQFSTASTASLTTQESSYTTAVTSLQTVMKSVYGSVFNCYFGVVQIGDPASYENLATVDGMLLNFLYNMGYMYNDIIYILNQSAAGSGS